MDFEIIDKNEQKSGDDEISKCLKQVKVLSEILSKQFKFVRVDWIYSNHKLYFNEMTFTPGSGFFSDTDNINFEKIAQRIEIQE